MLKPVVEVLKSLYIMQSRGQTSTCDYLYLFLKRAFLDVESLPKNKDLVKIYFPGAEEPGKFVLGLFMVNGVL